MVVDMNSTIAHQLMATPAVLVQHDVRIPSCAVLKQYALVPRHPTATR